MREYVFVQIILIIVVIIISIRSVQNIRVDKRINAIFPIKKNKIRYLGSEFDKLPDSIKKYIDMTGAYRYKASRRMKINYRGMYRSRKEKKWWRFILKTYVNFDDRSYIFDGCTRVIPGIKARFIDELCKGGGSFEFYLSSMFKFVEGNGEEIEYNSVLNYLIYCFLSPIYLAQEDFEWESEVDNEVAGRYTHNNQIVNFSVKFDENNKLESLHTMRYREAYGEFFFLPVEIKFKDYKKYEEYYLPSNFRYFWIENTSKLNFLNVEIIKFRTQ